jgi:hypothetical protein
VRFFFFFDDKKNEEEISPRLTSTTPIVCRILLNIFSNVLLLWNSNAHVLPKNIDFCRSVKIGGRRTDAAAAGNSGNEYFRKDKGKIYLAGYPIHAPVPEIMRFGAKVSSTWRCAWCLKIDHFLHNH